MQYGKPKIKISDREYEVLSFEEFKEKRGLLGIPNQTLDYQIGKDALDYCIIGRFRYIIWNTKAQTFNLNYARKTA